MAESRAIAIALVQIRREEARQGHDAILCCEWCFAASRWASIASSSRSAAVASAPCILPRIPGSTSASRSRSRTVRSWISAELLREPRLLASLNHPNIVTVITAEKQDDVFFIVMEYVPGETLETIIASQGRARLADRARLHVPDRQRRRTRPQTGRHPPRPPAGERVRHRKGPAQGRRLRHVAVSRNRRARHHGHRQPAVHGARTVRRARGLRLGRLLAGRDDVSDAHRRTAVRHARRRRTSNGSGEASWSSPCASRLPQIPPVIERHRHARACRRCRHRATSGRKICCRTSSMPGANVARPAGRGRRRSPAVRAARGRTPVRPCGRRRPDPHARDQRRAASAGTAGSRCRRAAAAAPSAAKRSNW